MPKSFELQVDSAIIRGQSVHSPGAKPSLIFLHAGVADTRMYSRQFAGLTNQCNITSFDRRGFGKTSATDEPFSQVDDLLAVVESVEGGKHILVGCSQGARIAIDFAIRYPKKIEALVLISATYSGANAPNPDAHEAALIAQIDAADERDDLEALNRLEAHLWLDGPHSEAGRVTAEARELFLDMNGIALNSIELTQEREPGSAAEKISTIECPVLLIEGGRDASFIIERHNQLASWLHNCRRAVVPQAAHLIPLETPAELNELLMKFLLEIG
ncbi:MAG: alpha/beta fold hydrolase [Pseudomonadales bacterium]